MATDKKLHFLITDCPGPFLLVSGWVHMLEKHGNRFEIELTLKPVEAGAELLGHDEKFKMTFEVVLMGATTKYGHDKDGPRNVRMLGRFVAFSRNWDVYRNIESVDELNKYQWEVVFNPQSRKIGFVAKLNNPLPERWEL